MGEIWWNEEFMVKSLHNKDYETTKLAWQSTWPTQSYSSDRVAGSDRSIAVGLAHFSTAKSN